MKKLILLLFLLISVLCLSKLTAAESSPEFIQGTDTLVVYADIPGLTPSDKYTIRVRSAATSNEWVDVFANYTYNRALELPSIINNEGKLRPNTVQAYAKSKGNWSHCFGTIEMSNNHGK